MNQQLAASLMAASAGQGQQQQQQQQLMSQEGMNNLLQLLNAQAGSNGNVNSTSAPAFAANPPFQQQPRNNPGTSTSCFLLTAH